MYRCSQCTGVANVPVYEKCAWNLLHNILHPSRCVSGEEVCITRLESWRTLQVAKLTPRKSAISREQALQVSALYWLLHAQNLWTKYEHPFVGRWLAVRISTIDNMSVINSCTVLCLQHCFCDTKLNCKDETLWRNMKRLCLILSLIIILECGDDDIYCFHQAVACVLLMSAFTIHKLPVTYKMCSLLCVALRPISTMNWNVWSKSVADKDGRPCLIDRMTPNNQYLIVKYWFARNLLHLYSY